MECCREVEEIIAEASDEFEKEEEQQRGGRNGTTKITFPNLWVLYLWKLQELKTICSNSKVIVCGSLEILRTYDFLKLKRLLLSLPLLNGQLSPPPSLQNIRAQWNRWTRTIPSLRMSFNPSSLSVGFPDFGCLSLHSHIFDLSFMGSSINL